MAGSSLTPLGAVGRGLVAGAVGTAAMTAAQTAYYKVTDTEQSSTPGEVAKRIIEGVLKRGVAEERMNALNQGMLGSTAPSWASPSGSPPDRGGGRHPSA